MMVPQDTPSDQIQERRYEEMARFAQEIIEPMKRASGPRREETP